MISVKDFKNRINDLRAMLKGIHRINHALNYDFSISEAKQLGKKLYHDIISYNHKYPAIKDSTIANKHDPYGLSLAFDFDTVYDGQNRIFGDNIDSLGDTHLYDDQVIEPKILEKLSNYKFLLKKQTCTLKQIDDANQYAKNHHISVQAPLTVSPKSDCKEILDNMINSYHRVAKAKGRVVADKTILNKKLAWNRLLDDNYKLDVHFTKSSLSYDEMFYRNALAEYKTKSSLIKRLFNQIHEYRNASVLVAHDHDSQLSGFRPATIEDLKKHTIEPVPFNKAYRSAVNALDSIKVSDVANGVAQLRRIVEHVPNSLDNYFQYDLGFGGQLAKNALSADIRYQHHNHIHSDYESDEEFAKDKRDNVRQDKLLLKRLQKFVYLNDDYKPYTVENLKETIRSLKSNLLITLFQQNKGNDKFNPDITVNQAHAVIDAVYRFAVYAKDVRYENRAKSIVDWVADKSPNAKISYRQLNPVGHYIYKQNINNIKKSLA